MKCDRETNDRVLSTKTYYIYYIRVKFHRGSETEVKFQGEKGTLTINEECSCIFKMDDGGCQIPMVFRFHWIHLKQ